jgi:hypothetical protein
MRQRDEGADAGGSRGIDAFIAEKERERAAYEADRNDSIGRDEQGEEPGTLVRRGGGRVLDR